MSLYRLDRIEYVQAAIESLEAQTLRGDLFVQCDGPIDLHVREYLEKLHASGMIVHLGTRSDNLGLAYSLNELLDVVASQGYTFIARMDADDLSLPKRFEKQVAFLEAHPDVDVVGGAIEEFSDEIAYRKIVRYPLKHDAMRAFFAKRVPLAHVTAMFRARFFDKAGYYPTQSPTNEDTLMWMEGFAHGCRFANLPDVLVRVRVGRDFFGRRGGIQKAWNDFKDRLLVIRTLRYNVTTYGYAVAMLGIHLSPRWLKKFFYLRLR
jgi:glycosyltransferase involved in cell wall biosynthesis